MLSVKNEREMNELEVNGKKLEMKCVDGLREKETENYRENYRITGPRTPVLRHIRRDGKGNHRNAVNTQMRDGSFACFAAFKKAIAFILEAFSLTCVSSGAETVFHI